MLPLYQSSNPPLFRPPLLLCAPRIAGLLPANAESLRPPPNPPSLTYTDYRLESIPPEHYHTFIASTHRLLRATVDFLVTQDAEEDSLMHLASVDFASEISEIFAPLIEIIKPQVAQKEPERIFTKEAMDAEVQPLIDEIYKDMLDLGWIRRPKQGGAS